MARFLLVVIYFEWKPKFRKRPNLLFHSAPYVRVLQLGPTGRVVKKKKTGAQHGTREPVFNETLNFELDLQQGGSAPNSKPMIVIYYYII